MCEFAGVFLVLSSMTGTLWSRDMCFAESVLEASYQFIEDNNAFSKLLCTVKCKIPRTEVYVENSKNISYNDNN